MPHTIVRTRPARARSRERATRAQARTTMAIAAPKSGKWLIIRCRWVALGTEASEWRVLRTTRCRIESEGWRVRNDPRPSTLHLVRSERMESRASVPDQLE